MSFFYPFKVNFALAAMKVEPRQFNAEWRSGMQRLGEASGLTPQETALAIVGNGLGTSYPFDAETAIASWRKEGKIDLSKPDVKEALRRMGFDVSGV